MNARRDCPTCEGEGEIITNPSWPDPRGETSARCPDCMGSGYRDLDWFDADQDLRSETAPYDDELPRPSLLGHLSSPNAPARVAGAAGEGPSFNERDPHRAGTRAGR